jgi:hypothetical protein
MQPEKVAILRKLFLSQILLKMLKKRKLKWKWLKVSHQTKNQASSVYNLRSSSLLPRQEASLNLQLLLWWAWVCKIKFKGPKVYSINNLKTCICNKTSSSLVSPTGTKITSDKG